MTTSVAVGTVQGSEYRAEGERATSLVSENLREALAARGLTVREAARAAGYSASTIERALTGGRALTLPHVAELCRVLGVRVESVLVPAGEG